MLAADPFPSAELFTEVAFMFARISASMPGPVARVANFNSLTHRKSDVSLGVKGQYKRVTQGCMVKHGADRLEVH